MNIAQLGSTDLIIDCTACGKQVSHPYSSLVILDEHLAATPPCTTPGCTRVGTFIPRQRSTDNPAHWAWEHNRAMNAAFRAALAAGAEIRADLDPRAKDRLAGQRDAGVRATRFPHEEIKEFHPTTRVISVTEELAAQILAADVAADAMPGAVSDGVDGGPNGG